MKKIFIYSSLFLGLLFAKSTFAQCPVPEEHTISNDQEQSLDPQCEGGGGGYTPPPVYGYLAPGASDGQGNAIILWEGNNCTQDEVGRHNLETDNKTFYYTYAGVYSGSTFFIAGIQAIFGVGPNDEARSISLQGVKAGRKIEFYDNSSGSTNDDWVEIWVKQDIASTDRYQLNSFEHSFEDAYVKVIYHSDNGLDGKVSRINTFMY